MVLLKSMEDVVSSGESWNKASYAREAEAWLWTE